MCFTFWSWNVLELNLCPRSQCPHSPVLLWTSPVDPSHSLGAVIKEIQSCHCTKPQTLQIWTFQREHSCSPSVSSNEHTCARCCLLTLWAVMGGRPQSLLWCFRAHLRGALCYVFQMASPPSRHRIISVAQGPGWGWGRDGHWEQSSPLSSPWFLGKNLILPASVRWFFSPLQCPDFCVIATH